MRALIIYRDIMPALETLTDTQLGALTRAALALVQDRNEPPDDPTLAFAWTVLREKITEQGRKYDEAADARAERAARARCRSICETTRSCVLSASHIVSILLRTTIRAATASVCVARCSRQIARSDLVTPVSAARMNTAACACGIRFTVNSGSAPMAFSPGVSRTTSPCLRSG